MRNQATYNVRTVKNLKDMIEQSTQLFGDKDAFLVKNSDTSYRSIKYSHFKQDIDALGTSLLSLGLKDKYIAVIGENRYEWCVSYLSIVNGTGVVVPLDKELQITEIENLLNRSNAIAIFFSGKFSNDMLALKDKLKQVKYFINMDGKAAQDGNDPFLSFYSLIEQGKKLIAEGDNSYINADVDAEVMNMLLFTSGTTDLAKGVMLSHKNICFDIMSVMSTVHVDSSDSALSILPLHHTYECSLGFLAMMYSGATISFNEGLKHISKNLKETKPTLLLTVPLLLENVYRKIWDQASKKRSTLIKLKVALLISNLLNNIFKIDIRKKLFKQIHESLGGRLRLILTGAAAINPLVSRGFRNFGFSVLQGYGLTECSPLAIGNRDKAFNDSSIGLPLPGVKAKIDNPDENGIGEILIQGDNVMLGYYQNDAATRTCLRDGWLYTGDLGYVDKKGFYYITGRKKNVIVTKNGKNIFPEEVESYINMSPFVQESLVWGKYDEITGETSVNAQIVPNFDAIREKLKVPSISKDEVFKLLSDVVKTTNRNMPLYKHIKQFTIRDNEFIKTTTKKIKRYIENKKI